MSPVIFKSMHWAARVFSVAYVGFFLYMFIIQTLPVFNNGRVQHFTTKEVIVLSVLGLYAACLLLAWKWKVLFGYLSFLLLAIFLFAVNAWSAPWFLIGFVPPVLYILSNVMERRTRQSID